MTTYNPTGAFAFRLKDLRKEMKLSQAELAKLLNVNQKTISFYEVGEDCPTLFKLLQLADIFNVSLDYLCGRSDFRQVIPPRRNKYGITEIGKLYEPIL